MPLYRDEGVVLRTHTLGEADRIVTLLTRANGKVRAVAKGVRRASSKFGARLEPFMVADVQLYVGRTLDVITQAESLGAYGASITGDYVSYTVANAMVEAADRITEAEGSLQQYALLVAGLRSLARCEHDPRRTLDSYLLRALAIAGWTPTFGECVKCGVGGPHRTIVVGLGGAVCDECAIPGSPRVSPDTMTLLGALLAGDWTTVDAATEGDGRRASGVVAAYAQWHLERGLRSLTYVEQGSAFGESVVHA